MLIIMIANFVALVAGLVLGDIVLTGFGGIGLVSCLLNQAIESDRNPTFQA
jgi:hypothetical protein